jgi:hypothetical protein
MFTLVTVVNWLLFTVVQGRCVLGEDSTRSTALY